MSGSLKMLHLQSLRLPQSLICAIFLWSLSPTHCQHSAGQTRSLGDNEKPAIYLLALGPYPDPQGRPSLSPAWTGGPGLIPAARLAVEQINNKTDLLADYEVKLVEGNSGCDIKSMAEIVYIRNVLYSSKNIVGIVGPGCSPAALELSYLNGPDKAAIVQVSIATSPLLADRSRNPYAFQTISSTVSYVDTLIALMAVNQWEHIAVLYSDIHTYYRTLAQKIRNSISIMFFSPMYVDTYIPLQPIKDSLERIILVLAPPMLARRLVCLAYHDAYKVRFPVYQLVFVDRVLSEFTATSPFPYAGKQYSCEESEMKTVLEGSVLISYKLETTEPELETISGLNYSDYLTEYREKVKELEEELGMDIPDQPYATVYHDAVWAMALALNSSIHPLEQKNLSLLDYHPGRNDITEVIATQFNRSDFSFNGVSGRINFDPSTGTSESSVDISQVQSGNVFHIGQFTHTKNLSYYGNGTFINDSFGKRRVHIEVGALVVVLIITGIQLALAFCLHIVNVLYAHHKTIRASSPRLNHLIFSGCYLLAISIIVFAILGPFPPSNAVVGGVMCNTVLWSANTGLTLILGTVALKMWRIYRIFIHFLNPGPFLHDRVLICGVLFLTVPTLVLSLVLTIVGPALQSVTEILDGGQTPIFEVHTSCSYHWYDVVLTSYNGILLIWALCLSTLSRHIRQKDFKATARTNLLLYLLSLISAIGFPLYIIATLQSESWDMHIGYVLFCVTLNGLLFSCLMFLLLPPVITLAREFQRQHGFASLQ